VNIAVIGLGLIGGSLLQALAAGGHRMWGYDSDPATRATARTAAAQAPPEARWQVTGELRDAVAHADLVVIAVPFPSVDEVLHGLMSAGYTGLVTDVTGVKAPVRDLVAQRLHSGHWRLAGYVGGHPMAGRETSGFAAADPSLFTGAPWVLCLEPDTSMADWLTLADLVTRLGARVFRVVVFEVRVVLRLKHDMLILVALNQLSCEVVLVQALHDNHPLTFALVVEPARQHRIPDVDDLIHALPDALLRAARRLFDIVWVV